jgi:hypothetical protein
MITSYNSGSLGSLAPSTLPMITSYNSGSLGSLVGGARDPRDPELYDVIIGNVEEARDPNDPELYEHHTTLEHYDL